MKNMETIAVDPDLYPPECAYSPDDWHSETTSIKSSIYRGLMDNGRRLDHLVISDKRIDINPFQTKNIGMRLKCHTRTYIYSFLDSVPSDEQQFETYEAGHIVDLIMDSDQPNPLFRSPIGTDRERPLQVLDIGTGKGTWAMYAGLFRPQ
ncbi:hypothetical protein N7517_011695 [Penicillium concentricum]|uniref:Uncharacterized protein n=1 Tax=Penicillium concentricum TaxID=293559 RepID=A0A9W9UW88_9EURO|nr:uncharacterized protein N7517_011695 [Penicillium concentricum]KAJ5357086.1 hypothetical protein N7517_011695 [Penicillium concentricum]